MESKDCFEKFAKEGKLVLDNSIIEFSKIQWSKHPTFDGVSLKHIVTSKETGGDFSYHLVKIEPNKKIGFHIHKDQLETHEVIFGEGKCINNDSEFCYQTGVISIFPIGIKHEITASTSGLLLFAKFFPALV
ncbi:cupin domain-containing protein [Fusobacterium sp. PH5-44]|uniref:cupin domain-containing protein n=1 Tax=unclassified Fusobacterium TaxID=2648384 RepID=UPI003D203290